MAEIISNVTDIKEIEIVLEKNYTRPQPDFNDFDSVFTVVTRLDKVQKLKYIDYDYMLNTHDPIEVTNGIWFEMREVEHRDKTGELLRIMIRLWTDVEGKSIKDLKGYIAECRREYETLKNNKLIGEKYYFDQTTSNDTKYKQVLCFDKKKYITNRHFSNVFFEEKEVVHERVKHFRNNKQWYDDRGIPYTLGFMFSGPAGTGKCLARGTSVLKLDGSVCPVEKLCQGDMLMGDDNTPRTIVSLATGRDTMYRISGGHGDSYVVNSAHILSLKLSVPFVQSWRVKESRYKLMWFEGFVQKQKSFTVRQPGKRASVASFINQDGALNALVAFKAALVLDGRCNMYGDVCDISITEYLARSKDWRHNFKGFKAERITCWKKFPVTLDPYMMGYWLGDGCSSKSMITSQDATVLHYFANTFRTERWNVYLKYQSKYDYYITTGTAYGGAERNEFTNALIAYNLVNNKHVPYDYRVNDVDTRMQLLAGFLDADGHLGETNYFEFSQRNRQVFDDIIFVARSLGFAVSEGKARVVKGVTYHRANIYGNGLDEIPTKIPRKRAQPYGHNKNPLVYDIKVECLEEDDYYGFELNNDSNKRFVLGDFTVTHNTSTIKAISTECDCDAIINVRMGAIRTNTQLNNLFYSNVLHVVNPDTLNVEKVVVPINRRLYVVEDIDSMTDLIMKRDLKFSERKRAVREQSKQLDKSPAVDFENLDIDDYLQDALRGEKIDMEREAIADESENTDKIDLSSLLNILDGTLENPGRIIVFTTNHPEVIDPALIRGGRVDLDIRFKLANRVIIKQMFESFYSDHKFTLDEFKKIREYHISPATINQIMFSHFGDPQAAIQEIAVDSNRRKTYKPRVKKGTQSDSDTEEEDVDKGSRSKPKSSSKTSR